MATESVSASEFNELASRYEALERQANSLLSAMSRGRTIRNFLLLALLVLVGALCYTMYSMANRLTSPKFMAELTDGAKVRMEKNGPAVQKQLLAVYERSSPTLIAAFKAQAEKDQPKYVKAAEDEWPKFKSAFEQKMEEKVRDQVKALIVASKPELEHIAPELKTDAKKYEQLELGLVGAAERVVDKQVNQRVLPQLDKLQLNWSHYPMAPAAKPGDESIGMQIVGHMFELLGIAFAKGDGLAAIVEIPNQKPKSSFPKKSDDNAKKGG